MAVRFVLFLFHSLFYVHGKQTRLCRNDRLHDHTVPGTAYRYSVHVIWPKSNSFLFWNQRKREISSPRMNVPDARVDLGAACIPRGHATDLATAPVRCQ